MIFLDHRGAHYMSRWRSSGSSASITESNNRLGGPGSSLDNAGGCPDRRGFR